MDNREAYAISANYFLNLSQFSCWSIIGIENRQANLCGHGFPVPFDKVSVFVKDLVKIFPECLSRAAISKLYERVSVNLKKFGNSSRYTN